MANINNEAFFEGLSETGSRPRPRRLSSLIAQPLVANPFSNTVTLSISKAQKVKAFVLGITIAPIRFVFAISFIVIAALFGNICVLGYKPTIVPEPLSGWRRIFQYLIKLCSRGAAFCLGFHWIKVKGKLASSKEAPILVLAPHSSFVDGFVGYAVLGHFTGVSRKENEDYFIIGNAFKACQPIYVARNEKGSRNDTVKEIDRRASTGGKWPQVGIFPEGTCTNRKCLITFKPGAFYPGLPVQPVLFRYPNEVDCVTWTWAGPPTWKLLWLMLSQFHNNAEIEILPVYTPTAEESRDAKLYARNVRDYMAKKLNVPTTDHSYEDARLMLEANMHKLPMETGLVEYSKINKKLGMNLDSIKELMSKFAEIDKDGDGLVCIEAFSQYLNLPTTPEVEALFRLYDINETGYVDFKEYLIGLSMVSEPSEETIKLAFSVFDIDNQGAVTEKGLQQILQNSFADITDLEIRCIFKQVDTNNTGLISYNDFKNFALKNPEYAVLFTQLYNQEETLKLEDVLED